MRKEMIKYRLMNIDTELQWGRNLIVAEGLHLGDGQARHRRFNGAAT